MNVQHPDFAGAAQSCRQIPELNGLEILMDEMRRGFRGMTERFDRMDQRLDRMDQRLDRMDQRLDRMDTWMKAEYILHLVLTY